MAPALTWSAKARPQSEKPWLGHRAPWEVGSVASKPDRERPRNPSDGRQAAGDSAQGGAGALGP